MSGFYSVYRSRAEYEDKQSVCRALFKKLLNKGYLDFKSKRSLQAMMRFKTKVGITP